MSIDGTQDVFDRIGISLAERASPIVVKEIRQGLRTKVFGVFFSLMLIACVVIALIAFSVGEDRDVGAGAFAAFAVVLAGVEFFVLPFLAFRSMAKEMEDETWVLLTLTGLGPRKVIRGKIASSVLQGLLYASAAAPFVLFSYYLNGIELFDIVQWLGFTAATHIVLVSIAVSLATLGRTKVARGLLQAAMIGGLVMGVFMLPFMISLFAVGRRGLGGPFSGASDAIFWGWATLLVEMVMTAVLFFESAAARLSLSTEPYARGPRLAFLVQALGTAALFIIGWVWLNEDKMLIVGACVSLAYATMVGSFIGSDFDGLAVNLEPSRASLLSPGAYRGFIVVATTIVVLGGLFTGLAFADEHTTAVARRVVVSLPFYALLYFSLPQLLSRVFGYLPARVPMMSRLFAVVCLAVGAGLPPIVGAMMGEPELYWVNVLNPLIGPANLAEESHDAFSIAVVGLAALAAALFAARRLKTLD